MPIIPITNFGGGIAKDYGKGIRGECSVCKHFDIFNFPNRLQPLRGFQLDDTSNTRIKNMMLCPSNGILYAVGTVSGDATTPQLWCRSDYTTDPNGWIWTPSSQLGAGATRNADALFLTYYGDETGTKKIFWASTNNIQVSSPSFDSASDNGALTFTTISNGYVHPTTKRLYFAYKVSATGACYLAQHDGTVGAAISPAGTLNATTGVWNTTVLTFPSQYTVYSITGWGDYLAIAATTNIIGGGVDSSVVFLWDMKSVSWNETIKWGEGQLLVLNNLDGYLVGISQLSSTNISGLRQDGDKIVIKMYSGGSKPQTVKEIISSRLNTTSPSCQINKNVNFVYEDKLYFSADVLNGDADANYYGLWAFGKNKEGRYALSIDRGATIDNSETSILAAVIAGDYVFMTHTAYGTQVKTINSSSLSSIYGNRSFWESCINPEMPEEHYNKKKNLIGVSVTCLPLLDATSEIVIKYRVDSDKSDTWTTIATKTNALGETKFEAVIDSSGNQFTSGVFYEFRLESTGGARINSFTYKYDILNESL